MEKPTTTLRNLLARPGLLIAPGVADAMNARIVAKEGFELLYMTGSGTTAVRLGMPDVGLLTLTEMVDNAQRIAEAAEIPLIADADTGYGNPVNVVRTVRAYERAGVAAIHLEDQQWPKRCGHMTGKSLVSVGEMVGKIRAATDTRQCGDFIIIARTDAYSVEGYNAAMERAARYVEAGADIIFVEELRSAKELAEVPRRFTVPALYNMASSGKTPLLSAAEIEHMGFKIVIYPNILMRAQIRAAQLVLRELKATGALQGILDKLSGWEERVELLRMSQIRELEERYDVDEKLRVGL